MPIQILKTQKKIRQVSKQNQQVQDLNQTQQDGLLPLNRPPKKRYSVIQNSQPMAQHEFKKRAEEQQSTFNGHRRAIAQVMDPNMQTEPSLQGSEEQEQDMLHETWVNPLLSKELIIAPPQVIDTNKYQPPNRITQPLIQLEQKKQVTDDDWSELQKKVTDLLHNPVISISYKMIPSDLTKEQLSNFINKNGEQPVSIQLGVSNFQLQIKQKLRKNSNISGEAKQEIESMLLFNEQVSNVVKEIERAKEILNQIPNSRNDNKVPNNFFQIPLKQNTDPITSMKLKQDIYGIKKPHFTQIMPVRHESVGRKIIDQQNNFSLEKQLNRKSINQKSKSELTSPILSRQPKPLNQQKGKIPSSKSGQNSPILGQLQNPYDQKELRYQTLERLTYHSVSNPLLTRSSNIASDEKLERPHIEYVQQFGLGQRQLDIVHHKKVKSNFIEFFDDAEKYFNDREESRRKRLFKRRYQADQELSTIQNRKQIQKSFEFEINDAPYQNLPQIQKGKYN